jgi:predicted NBD/HSP70 family sugar kinase
LPVLTGLSGGTITQLTKDLVRRGLVVESREGSSRPGRPRTHLEVNAQGAILIGASLREDDTLATAFVNLAGAKVFSKDLKIRSPASLAGLADEIAVALQGAIEDYPFDRSLITRIGIAMPAVIDSVRGIVHFMATLPAGPFPFANAIAKRLKLPVTIENDMVCMARAQHWFGPAQALDTFTLIHVGFTLGSAQYKDGLPNSGANGFNQELGHTKSAFDKAKYPCFCGGQGCLTTYCSEFGILTQAGLLKSSPFPSVQTIVAKFRRLLDRADAGDKRALALFDAAGFQLGLVVANHLNADDPGNVLILMHERRFLKLVARSFHPALRENTLPGLLPNTTIRFGLADKHWRWKGTAALALEKAYLESS